MSSDVDIASGRAWARINEVSRRCVRQIRESHPNQAAQVHHYGNRYFPLRATLDFPHQRADCEEADVVVTIDFHWRLLELEMWSDIEVQQGPLVARLPREGVVVVIGGDALQEAVIRFVYKFPAFVEEHCDDVIESLREGEP